MNLFKTHYPALNTGLLLLRIGIGISFILHGWPKMAGGPEGWTNLGGAMGNLGITFAPTFWGFMGAFAEFGGGILLLLGLLFRPVCLLMLFTMLVATLVHLKNGDDFSALSHPIEMGTVFLALFFTGPGKYSLDYYLGRNNSLNSYQH